MRPHWNRVGTDPLTAVLCKGNKDAETHTGRRQPGKMKTKAAAMQLQKRQTTDGRQPRGAAEARPSLEASAGAWHADSCFMPLAPERQGVRFHRFKPPSLCPDSAATIRSRTHFPGGQSPFLQVPMSQGTPSPSGDPTPASPQPSLPTGRFHFLFHDHGNCFIWVPGFFQARFLCIRVTLSYTMCKAETKTKIGTH